MLLGVRDGSLAQSFTTERLFLSLRQQYRGLSTDKSTWALVSVQEKERKKKKRKSCACTSVAKIRQEGYSCWPSNRDGNDAQAEQSATDNCNGGPRSEKENRTAFTN